MVTGLLVQCLLVSAAQAAPGPESVRASAEAGFLQSASSPRDLLREALQGADGMAVPFGRPGEAPPAPKAEEEKPEVGAKAPSFTLESMAGKAVESSSFTGKVVLLDFWASWCGPCKAATNALVEFHKDFGKKGLSIVAVNVWDQKKAAQDYLDAKAREGKKVEYTTLFDPAEVDDEKGLASRYGVGGLPTFVLIGVDGKIISIESGFDKAGLKAKIEEALKAVAAPPAKP